MESQRSKLSQNDEEYVSCSTDCVIDPANLSVTAGAMVAIWIRGSLPAKLSARAKS